ncbi:protein O-mannosyl-transferase TMEM260-like [Babylonia areolata]|uniref:protein O-mannosyl-transferase TMEM260-like n=1 Tax=Babylonia areolata TaxID=304850 RepID=UPI003FD1AFB9
MKEGRKAGDMKEGRKAGDMKAGDKAGHHRSSVEEEEGEGAVVWSRMQVVVMGVVLAVYLTTLHSSLPGGDAGELIVAASELGVAHPPGYPLYTILMKAVFHLLPCGSLAWRANLLTAVMAAAAAACLYQAVRLLTNSMAAGWMAAGLFSFSRLTWAWSVTAEVFALNNLLLAALVLTAVVFSRCSPDRAAQVSRWGAVLCGLCLTNQHTSVVYIAVIVPWVLYTLYSHKVLSWRLLTEVSLCFVLGLLPYAYLPLSSLYGHARWTWGDHTSLSGFLTHLLRREYGTLHLLKDHQGQGFIAGLLAYCVHVSKDLSSPVLFFFVTTAFSLHTRWQKGGCGVLVVLLVAVSTYTIFFAWRANLDIEKPLFRGVVERFWLQSDLIVVVMASVAFSDVMGVIQRLVPVQKYHVDKLAAVFLVTMQIAINVGHCDQSDNRTVEDFARTVLAALPPNALVLTKGDLPSNSLRYFHLVEGVRPDITLFDQEVLTYQWSVPMLGRHVDIQWPGSRLYLHSGTSQHGVQHFTFRQLLDAHYHRRPIFGCIGVQDHEPSWQEAYHLRPLGVCVQFVKKGAHLDLDEWLSASTLFTANWSHPLPASESTWEDVASAEMWRAKTVAGLYLLESVDSIQNTKEKSSLLRHAYQIYKDAMTSNAQFPSYWHKNFALVCDKLRQVVDPAEGVSLMRSTLTHFRAYLRSDPQDTQEHAIRDAIDKLHNYLDVVSKTG